MKPQSKGKTVKADSIFTNSGSGTVLSVDTIRKAVELLKANESAICISHISSSWEWWTLIAYDPTIRGMSLYGGIPLFIDPKIPKEVARVHYNDGSYKDITIKSTPTFIPPSKRRKQKTK